MNSWKLLAYENITPRINYDLINIFRREKKGIHQFFTINIFYLIDFGE